VLEDVSDLWRRARRIHGHADRAERERSEVRLLPFRAVPRQNRDPISEPDSERVESSRGFRDCESIAGPGRGLPTVVFVASAERRATAVVSRSVGEDVGIVIPIGPDRSDRARPACVVVLIVDPSPIGRPHSAATREPRFASLTVSAPFRHRQRTQIPRIRDGSFGPMALRDGGVRSNCHRRQEGAMKAVVVYESMYGNTHIVAEAISNGIADIADVVVVPVERATPDLLAGADVVIVGGPTHVHGMTREKTRQAAVEAAHKSEELELDPDALGTGLRDWFDMLPGFNAKAAAFDTRVAGPAMLTGRASKGIARSLREHGFTLIAEPESFLVTKSNVLVGAEEARAELWAVHLANLLAPAFQH
jgi:hypothetical protein